MKHCQQEMTVIQNAWPVVCNFGWLIEADRNARKGKRYRAEVLNFTARLEDNLFTIQQGMMNGSYVLGPYRKLWVYVPKKRLVMALDYPDRIVQWSLYLYLNPIYDRLFIEDSYACRKDKGSHKAAKRLQYWMCQVQRKPGPGWYCLKLDISKYFYRVNHEKLLAILERRVKDPAMMAFIRGVVNSRAEPFGLPRWRTPQDTPPEEWLYEVGMPIGNLTSQLFANIYLSLPRRHRRRRVAGLGGARRTGRWKTKSRGRSMRSSAAAWRRRTNGRTPALRPWRKPCGRSARWQPAWKSWP